MSIIGKLREKWKAKRDRKSIPSIGRTKPDADAVQVVIETPWGNVPESARRQAAINMKLDPAKRRAVEELLIAQMGSQAAGVDESRRRYPEAYE